VVASTARKLDLRQNKWGRLVSQSGRTFQPIPLSCKLTAISEDRSEVVRREGFTSSSSATVSASEHLHAEEIRGGDGAPMGLEESLPGHRLSPEGSRLDAVLLGDALEGRASGVEAEVLERAAKPRVAPGWVLARHRQQTRSQYVTTIRGLARASGLLLPTSATANFVDKVNGATMGEPLRTLIAPLVLPARAGAGDRPSRSNARRSGRAGPHDRVVRQVESPRRAQFENGLQQLGRVAGATAQVDDAPQARLANAGDKALAARFEGPCRKRETVDRVVVVSEPTSPRTAHSNDRPERVIAQVEAGPGDHAHEDPGYHRGGSEPGRFLMPWKAAGARSFDGSFDGVDVGPESGYVEREALAAGNGVDVARGDADGVGIPPVSAKLKDLEGAELWVDEPVPGDPEGGVLGELLDAVAAFIAWGRRHNLDGDAGRHVDETSLWRSLGAGEVDGEIGHPAAIGTDGELGARGGDEGPARSAPVA
jgi:hypothetical protein